MMNIKLINENSVEIAKVYKLLEGTTNFINQIFDKIETEDPQGKINIMQRLDGLLEAMRESIIHMQENNEKLRTLYHISNDTKN
jgi:hypothetical protein